MKSILAVVVVVLACLVVFTYVTTGKFGIIPSTDVSPEEAELNRLSDRFESLENEFYDVTKGSLNSGIDTGGDIENIFREMDRIEAGVKKVADQGSSMEIRAKAKKILERINRFKLDSR